MNVTMAAVDQTNNEPCTRTRLLNRLGMFQEKRMSSSCQICPSVPNPKRDYITGTTTGTTTTVGRVAPTHEELKDHSENYSSLPPPCQKIRFNPSASVVYIPIRNQYSNRIKKHIWTNRYELAENAQRNTLEFEYEGYDFNKVVLEDDMYIDCLNGELVHPCHILCHDSPSEKEDDLDNNFNPLKKQEAFDFFGRFRETLQVRINSLITGM
jgi:hypothetical protein